MKEYDNLFKLIDVFPDYMHIKPERNQSKNHKHGLSRRNIDYSLRKGASVVYNKYMKYDRPDFADGHPSAGISKEGYDSGGHIIDSSRPGDRDSEDNYGSAYDISDIKEKMLESGYETATFAAGSFWRAEAIFRKVKGVLATAVGFMGGSVKFPTYEQVSEGNTGHVEAVQVVFDPQKVRYEKLLELFWVLHNPTVSGEEGPEVQSQYRSVIFYHNERQRDLAISSKKEQESSGKFKRSIATEIVPATRFYKAREYHQQYYEKMDGGKKLR